MDTIYAKLLEQKSDEIQGKKSQFSQKTHVNIKQNVWLTPLYVQRQENKKERIDRCDK